MGVVSGRRAERARAVLRTVAGRMPRGLRSQRKSLRVLLRVFWHFLPLWPWQLGLIVASFAAISAELAEPWLHEQLVNRVLIGRQVDLLPRILVLYVAVATAHWVAHSAAHYFHLQGSERFSIRLRTRTYAHLRRLSQRALRVESSGELVAVLQQFGPEVGEGYLELLAAVFAALYRLPASLALLARLNGGLLLTILPALSLYPLYPLVTVRPLRRALTGLALYDVATQGVVNDHVVGLPALMHRVDGRTDVTSLRDLLWRRLSLRIAVFTVDRLGGLLDVAAHQGLAVLLFGLGGMAVLQGRMSVGALLAFMEYVRGLEGPVRRLMHLPIGAQRVAVVADRVYAVLDRPVDVVAPRHGRHVRHFTGGGPGALALRAVGVTGGADGRPILRDLTVTLPAGALCAVVGGSGAGKSTFGALLPRLLDPDSGSVTLDGVDLREYDLRELRGAVAHVPQNPIFFRDTLLANLLLARPDASAAEVDDALERACCGDFLIPAAPSSPRGGLRGITAASPSTAHHGPAGSPRATGTPVSAFEGASPDRAGAMRHPLSLRLSEGAGNLSGGQRQRLGLARGFLQGGCVLVLDEVLSGLDPVLQAKVFSQLTALRGQRTVVLITHQWELARRCDIVVLLAEGRLVRVGPPAQVLGRA